MRGLDKIVDALDALQRGEFLTTRQAATICEVSDQTIINWIDHSISIGRPIAEKRASWIISASRQFDYVEQHCGGRPARAKAKNLLKALWPRWSQAPELGKDAKERVVQPIGPGVQE